MRSVKLWPRKGTNDFLSPVFFYVLSGSDSVSFRHPGALSRMRRDDMVTLDHPVQSLSIDCEDARRRLLVSTSVFEHAGDVAALDFREWDPVFNLGLIQRNLRLRRGLRWRKSVFRLQHRAPLLLDVRSHKKRVAAFHKLYLQVVRSRASWVRMFEVAPPFVIPGQKTFQKGRQPRPGRLPSSTREEFTPF